MSELRIPEVSGISENTLGSNQLDFHYKTVYAYHPFVFVLFFDPPGNYSHVVRAAVAACL